VSRVPFASEQIRMEVSLPRDEGSADINVFQDASNSRVAPSPMDATILRPVVAPWRPPEVP